MPPMFSNVDNFFFPLETKGILVQSYIFFSVSYGNGIVQSWTFIDDLKINLDLSLQ